MKIKMSVVDADDAWNFHIYRGDYHNNFILLRRFERWFTDLKDVRRMKRICLDVTSHTNRIRKH
jgi:hypothetical protein